MRFAFPPYGLSDPQPGQYTAARRAQPARKKREPGYPRLPFYWVFSRLPDGAGGRVYFSGLGSGSSANLMDGTTSTGTGRARRATSRTTRSVVEPRRCRPTKPCP
jgi:hypothetical protein